jgi:hypothetical protein
MYHLWKQLKRAPLIVQDTKMFSSLLVLLVSGTAFLGVTSEFKLVR